MTYPIICIICYTVVTLVKRTSLAKEWLPLLSGCTGALLAVLSFYTLPQYLAAESVLHAAFHGALSGLAATGGNQVFKQAVKLFCKNHGIDYDRLDQLLPNTSEPTDSTAREETETEV
ncbi:MAG: phage holin family protein [Clostridia bacterium]|nr:phage holin family protein [Clostridia bacterium]